MFFNVIKSDEMYCFELIKPALLVNSLPQKGIPLAPEPHPPKEHFQLKLSPRYRKFAVIHDSACLCLIL